MTKPLRGVNLGGWLVIEKWITPSLFKGVNAADEHGLLMSPEGAQRVKDHRQNFITERDFVWLRDQGVQAVRIPVGYWLFEETPPFLVGEKYLDWAFEMAEKYGLQVLLSLHGAPGSQNGKHHSGKKGSVYWYRRKYRQATTGVLFGLAVRYGSSPSLWGIELLNEPDVKSLRQFLQLRFWTWRVLGQLFKKFPTTWFVYSDAFNPRRWAGIGGGVLDIHHYQCFSAADKRLDLDGHVRKAHKTKSLLRMVASIQPVIVGEWSAALDGKSLGGVSREEAERRFIKAQLETFKPTAAWFYWTYKTEDGGAWSFRDVVGRGSFDES